MGLFNFFKRKTPEPKFKGRVFDYHEDDFCRIELLPKENMENINMDLQSIHQQTKTIERNISVSTIEKILSESSLVKFDTVTTGYGSQQYDSEYSTAYGQKGCAIIFERNKDHVDHIWLDYYPAWPDDQNRSAIKNCLLKICSVWDLIIVDWRQKIVIDPTNTAVFHQYLTREEHS